jgi:HNH endonuclease
MAKPIGPLEPRFWSKVAQTSENDCWFWKASIDANGYGQFGLAPGQFGVRTWTMAKAHRVAWLLTKGEIPPGMYLCHTCDMPRCVNPTHLFLGTQTDNMRDCVEKNRHGCGRVGQPIYYDIKRIRRIIDTYTTGAPVAAITKRHEISETHLLRILKRHKIPLRDSRTARRKLTDIEIQQIRQLYAMGNVSQQALGERFGVTQSNIGHIVRGSTWPEQSGPTIKERRYLGRHGYSKVEICLG